MDGISSDGTSHVGMMASPKTADQSSSPRQPAKGARKKRRRYIVTVKTGDKGMGFELLNDKALFADGPKLVAPPPGQRGFRQYPEPPLFRADPKLGRIDWDFEEYVGYWLISDRMKAFLENYDPDAFVFLKCKTQLPDGSEGPSRWLCDVVRVLDSLDEEKSEIRIKTADNGSKVYGFSGRVCFVFKEDVVGSAHVFRMKYAADVVICDDDLKRAYKASGLKGMRFRETDEYRK